MSSGNSILLANSLCSIFFLRLYRLGFGVDFGFSILPALLGGTALSDIRGAGNNDDNDELFVSNRATLVSNGASPVSNGAALVSNGAAPETKQAIYVVIPTTSLTSLGTEQETLFVEVFDFAQDYIDVVQEYLIPLVLFVKLVSRVKLVVNYEADKNSKRLSNNDRFGEELFTIGLNERFLSSGTRIAKNNNIGSKATKSSDDDKYATGPSIRDVDKANIGENATGKRAVVETSEENDEELTIAKPTKAKQASVKSKAARGSSSKSKSNLLGALDSN
ncbi:hypothetical protein BT67DRAFT_430797 [Trichocladium antarcticum]|uniref:Uncharacterized protein n=1 Tax=Trichocladium antarcticum TaxID=1450529 RepID=A0AAN6URY9_9PEZI|nr:hypothetical protein BT67DRAFT_430797 [Trichocladium antarcticum]